MEAVSENIAVKEYFEEIVPKIFEEQMASSPIGGMEGTEFTVQFDIKGDQEQTYGITAKDAKDLKVTAGSLDSPLVRVELSEDVWRKAVTGKMAGSVEMFTDMGQMADRKRFDALKSTKGAITLNLTLPDGSIANIRIVLNNSESPSVAFAAAADDWAKVATGEIPGPTAFMSGKLKIDGDLPFAMQLGNLMS